MAEERANNDPIEDPPSGTDQLAEDETATGGDDTTEQQLEADNPAEEETLKALDPGAPSA
jgi:hypothetical protein